MKTVRFFSLLAGLLLAVSASAQRKIQVALFLDTSSSMDGLIEQAKSQLWSIVNEMALAKADGRTPDIEIALYEYGNDHLSAREDYIRQVVPLSRDLDRISEALFSLGTYGGNEYCGAMIGRGLKDLAWSASGRDLKLIYIAGNEPFDQGSVDYRTVCRTAISRGIVVNTIFCGDYEEGIRTFWKNGAELGEGKYFNINQNRATVYVETPYDKQINELNGKLNETYIGYGALGVQKKEAQAQQDRNAAKYSAANAAERTVSKSGAAYRADDWDLVDAYKNDKIDVKTLKTEDLPAELKGKSLPEIKAYVEKKSAERDEIQGRIRDLNQKRAAYLATESKKTGGDQSLNGAMSQALRERAEKQGFLFSK